MADPEIGLTGYVAWTLAESGFKGKALDKALAWLETHLDEATQNPYALALAANAFAAAQPEGKTTKLILQTLDGMKTPNEHGVAWTTEGQTLCYSRGNSASVEITALVAYAMQQAGAFTPTVNQALSYLVATRGSSGAWGSTQATILALKALVRGLAGEKLTKAVAVTVTVNGKKQEITIEPDQADVLRLLDFGPATRKGKNTVTITADGKSGMMYQVVGRYFLPWTAGGPEPTQPIAIDVSYDRTELTTDDLLTANVHFAWRGAVTTYMVIIDLGIPPGFTVDQGCFAELVSQNKIEKYSVTGRQVTLYLGGLKPGQTLDFSYTLRAKYPIKAKTPKSTAYEYYTPENRDDAEPVELIVR